MGNNEEDGNQPTHPSPSSYGFQVFFSLRKNKSYKHKAKKKIFTYIEHARYLCFRRQSPKRHDTFRKRCLKRSRGACRGTEPNKSTTFRGVCYIAFAAVVGGKATGFCENICDI